ncbi:thiol:disulfide interchange protein DsbA/DsbL [Pasteurellaceae bacterium 22721_9_1]
MRYLVILCLFWSAQLWALEEQANKTEFEDGKDYFSYSSPLNVPLPQGKVLIQSFFDYDCRVCSNTQDILTLYRDLNPNKVVLEEFPVATKESYFSAQVFSTLQHLKHNEIAGLLLFETANVEQFKHLSKLENLHAWLAEHKVDPLSFDNVFHSEPVTKEVNASITRTEKYGVFTYPFVVINGQYVLTNSTLYNDDYSFAVLDYLVNKLTIKSK